MQDSETKRTRDVQLSVREALSSKKEVSRNGVEADVDGDNDNEDEADFDARIRKRNELGDLPPKPKLRNGM